ncbi:HEAT repeat domain-containing protein [Shewanella sp. 125m-1]
MMKKNAAPMMVLVSVLLICIGIYLLAFDESLSQGRHSNDAKAITTDDLRSDKTLLIYDFADNGVYAYQIMLDIDGVVDASALTQGIQASGSQRQNMSIRANAQVHFKFYPQQTSGWHVLGQYSDLRYINNGQEIETPQGAEHQFSFDFSQTGQITNLATNTATQGADFTQLIINNVQLIYPNQYKSSWLTRELDENGTYKAQYQLLADDGVKYQPLTIIKNKLSYQQSHLNDMDLGIGLADVKVSIEEHQAEFVVDQHSGWFQSINTIELINSEIMGKTFDDIKMTFAANSMAVDSNVRFPDFYAQVSKANTATPSMADYYATEPKLNMMAQGLNTEEAVGRFVELFSDPNTESLARKFMVNYLRLYPVASGSLVQELDTKSERVDLSVKLALWSSLTEAGHTEAQQAVAAAATDAAFNPTTRNRAIAYAHDFEYPITELVDSLFAFHQGASGAVDAVNSELGSMAIYAVGTLGGSDKLNPTQAQHVETLLREQLQDSSQAYHQDQILTAIANSRNPSFVSDVEAFLISDNSDLRVVAYTTMLRLQGSDAINTFTQGLANETDPMVRELALRDLSTSNRPEAVTWASEEVLRHKDSAGATSLVTYLGEHKDSHSVVETTLRELLSSEVPVKLKQEIYKYIAPGQAQ